MPRMAPMAHGSTPKPHASAETNPADRPEASAVRDTVRKLGPGLIAATRWITATVSSGCTDVIDDDLRRALRSARAFLSVQCCLDDGDDDCDPSLAAPGGGDHSSHQLGIRAVWQKHQFPQMFADQLHDGPGSGGQQAPLTDTLQPQSSLPRLSQRRWGAHLGIGSFIAASTGLPVFGTACALARTGVLPPPALRESATLVRYRSRLQNRDRWHRAETQPRSSIPHDASPCTATIGHHIKLRQPTCATQERHVLPHSHHWLRRPFQLQLPGQPNHRPGTTLSYAIAFNGSGHRNQTRAAIESEAEQKAQIDVELAG